MSQKGKEDKKDEKDKAAQREAREVWDTVKQALGAGNYRKARELSLEVAKMAPDSDLGREAKSGADDLRIDSWAIYAGLGFTVLYLMGWVAAL